MDSKVSIESKELNGGKGYARYSFHLVYAQHSGCD